MAKRTAARKAAPTLDLKALSAELGATVKEGRVSEARNRYYLTVGKQKMEIPVGTAVSRRDISQFVGQVVPVVVSGATIIAVGRVRGPGCYMILCYKPAPNIFGGFQEALRAAAVDQLAKAGKIDAGLAQTLKQGRASVQILGG